MKLKKLTLMLAVAGAVAAFSSCSDKAKTSAETADASAENVEATAPEAVAQAAPAVIELEKGAVITPKEGRGVVIDFNATWCGPCKKFGPNFEAVAAKNQAKADFYSVDVDVHPELAAQYGVESIPMVAYIAPDGTVNTTVGYLDEAQFASAVAQYIP